MSTELPTKNELFTNRECAESSSLAAPERGTEVREGILQRLLQEPRMNYQPFSAINSLPGLYHLIEEYFQPSFSFTIAEIGSFRGVSTELFALFCKRVYAIDRWISYADVEEEFMQTAERAFALRMKPYENVYAIKQSSEIAASNFDNCSLDAIYIDGEHSEWAVARDLQMWMPKVKPNGFICGHDFSIPAVQKSVVAILGELPLATYEDTSFIYIKKALVL